METRFSERPEGNQAWWKTWPSVVPGRYTTDQVARWQGARLRVALGFHLLAGEKKVEAFKKFDYQGCSATSTNV